MTATDQTKINYVKACDILMEKLGCPRGEAAENVNLILEGVAHGLAGEYDYDATTRTAPMEGAPQKY